MSSISVLELVKSALDSNDEVILRTIYDDLSYRLRNRRMVSTEEHSNAIRASWVEILAPSNLFKSLQRKVVCPVFL